MKTGKVDSQGKNTANNIVTLDNDAKLPAVDGSALTGIGGSARIAVITTTGASHWTTPAGVTKVYLTMIGGGGGGTNGPDGSIGGGAGASGKYCIKFPFTVVASTEYDVVVGTGGAADNVGLDTSFSTITVKGGNKPTATTAAGATAGNNSLLGISTAGETGRTGRWGGKGGCSPLGNGGVGGDDAGGSYPGLAPTEGYGGGGGGGCNSSYGGGAGAQGIVIIEW